MERRTPLVQLDGAEVADLVAAVLPGAEVRACAPQPGGHANTNYRVVLADRAVLLRLYTRDPAACAKEHALARLLAADLPVARSLGHGEASAGPYALFEYLPGATLAERAPRMAAEDWTVAGRALGWFLAALARHTFDRPGNLAAPPLRVEAWPWAGGDLLGFVQASLFSSPAGQRLGPALRDEVWAFAVEAARRWEPWLPVHLAHGDFGPTNLLFDGGRLTGVVDWEFAHAGDLSMDLGNLLRPRSGYAPQEALATGLEQGLLAEGVALPADWRARAAFADLAAALEFLSSVADRPATHAAARDRIAATVRTGR